jgi:hypothetical protein
MSKDTAPNRRREATEKFKRVIDAAISEARHFNVDVRDLAGLLDQRADALRIWFATTAPTGHSL